MKYLKFYENYESDEDDYEDDYEEIQIPKTSIEGEFYHGSVIQDCEFFSDLDPNYSDWLAVWFSDKEDIAKKFGESSYREEDDEYLVILKAKIESQNIADLMDIDLVEELKDFYMIEDFREIIPILIEKGFDGWVTTGSIDGYQYVDYAIFDDDIYDIKEAKINARGWTEYMPLDKAKQFLSSVCD